VRQATQVGPVGRSQQVGEHVHLAEHLAHHPARGAGMGHDRPERAGDVPPAPAPATRPGCPRRSWPPGTGAGWRSACGPGVSADSGAMRSGCLAWPTKKVGTSKSFIFSLNVRRSLRMIP
jgi:hypothetical protein